MWTVTAYQATWRQWSAERILRSPNAHGWIGTIARSPKESSGLSNPDRESSRLRDAASAHGEALAFSHMSLAAE
jgi:hypothetical protein